MTTASSTPETVHHRRGSIRFRHPLDRHEHLADLAAVGGEKDLLAIDEVLETLPYLMFESTSRRRGAAAACRRILEWLFTFPGSGWQERWVNSGADKNVEWIDAFHDRNDPRAAITQRGELLRGVTVLLVGRVVFPSYEMMLSIRATGLYAKLRTFHRPELFSAFESQVAGLAANSKQSRRALQVAAKIVLHSGRDLDRLTPEDLQSGGSTHQPRCRDRQAPYARPGTPDHRHHIQPRYTVDAVTSTGPVSRSETTRQTTANEDTHAPRDPDELLDRVRELASSHPITGALLRQWDQIALPDSWLSGSLLAQTRWNQTHGFDARHGIADADIVYFDPTDLTDDAEEHRTQRVNDLFADLGVRIDVKNQARVHLWYEKRFGYPIEPYTDACDAIASFPTTAASVGIRLTDNEFEVYAPYGLTDLLAPRVVANPTQITEQIYQAKIQRWARIWPQLPITPWPTCN